MRRFAEVETPVEKGTSKEALGGSVQQTSQGERLEKKQRKKTIKVKKFYAQKKNNLIFSFAESPFGKFQYFINELCRAGIVQMLLG